MAKKQSLEKCKVCNEKIGGSDFYLIYRMLTVTNKEVHLLNLFKLSEELGNYIMNKGYHLSATQIILLRPDILKEYLNKKYAPEKVMFSILQESEICPECFGEYSKLIPLR